MRALGRLVERAWAAQQARHDDYKANATPARRAWTFLAWAVLIPPLIFLFPLMLAYRVVQRLVRFTFTRPA